MNNLNLNLLPRKPFLKQYFRQLFTVLIMAILIPFAVMLIGYITDSINESSLKAEIADMDNRVQVMSKRLQVNPVTASYEELSKSVDELEALQTDWKLIIDRVEFYLPAEAKYIDISGKNNNLLEVSYQFNRMSEVIHYMDQLEQEPMIDDVKLTSISRKGEQLNSSAYDRGFELSIKHTVNISIVFHSNEK
ncbi:hypothetical protein K0T92_03660 [Paenibacillus oenotherae]|uniref:Tfp pilus assembly protein PilN n=1 Tax=Paenibacillus oenotherae TaxID=1435645 RepID=A0ABS7D1M2_9BACL|nr:hypothetical protein [Paenibacillus oenotherae]MBW7473839.1 hypothetical protein [Paenibacillus oenotherae]